MTGNHILAFMLEFERRVSKYTLPLIDHCTDSAANSLNALILLASPSTYDLPELSLSFLGLCRNDYIYYAPFFIQSIHLLLTLAGIIPAEQYDNLTLVCGKPMKTSAGFQNYKTADIQDIRKLKVTVPSCSLQKLCCYKNDLSE